MTEESAETRIARLEEKQKAEEIARTLAFEALETWKASSNEWRQALNDQRSSFITRAEMIAWLTVGLVLLGLILKYTK